MTARSVSLPLLLRFAAAALSITLPCACSAVQASNDADDAATREAAKPAGPSAPGADAAAVRPPAMPDRRVYDTELGRALAALDSDPRKAAASFEALDEKLAYLDDVLAYYEAVSRGRFDRAAGRRGLDAFLSDHADSILRADAAAELARLVEADGDADTAVALGERYGRGGPDSSEAASVCLSAGRVFAKKDPVRAAVYLQCARSKSPLSGSARSAYELLTAIRREHEETRPSGATGLMAEARLLGREGRGEEQAALLRDLLEHFPGSEVEGEAELAYGRNLGRSGSKSAGAAFFERRAAGAAGARKAKLLYEAGTLYWNDDRNDQAIPLFQQMLAMKTGIGDEQQALYALARISDTQNRQSDAIEYYGRAAAAARGATRAECKWRQGWVSYRARDFETAERTFASMAETAARGSDTDGRADALYWQGRSLERLGRKDEARRCYLQVLDEFPVGYYAATAEQRLGRRVAAQPVVPQSAPATLPPAASLAIRRARTLREAGLVTLATRDLTQRLSGFDADTRRAILPALPSSGAYDAAFRIAIEMTDNGQLSRDEARVYFYPRAHADIVEREAGKAGIDPVLVYALMRQESAFASTAVSSAKALGLMQLLESTAQRVAAASGLPSPQPDDLFDPAVNIRLGVRYLAELSRLFDRNTALMAAAYNAGETAAARWQILAKTFDEDEMIEQISYRETRLYVKSILRNMRNYRSIYGAESPPIAKAQ